MSETAKLIHGISVVLFFSEYCMQIEGTQLRCVFPVTSNTPKADTIMPCRHIRLFSLH